MKDFVVYHNPDRMGCDVTQMSPLSAVTNKPTPADVEGSRVWLLTGQGKPRTFLLRSWFIVDRVEKDVDGFRTKVSGKIGTALIPMINLNDEAWFESFKRKQGRFAFGLQRITVQPFIRGLEEVVRREAKSSIKK